MPSTLRWMRTHIADLWRKLRAPFGAKMKLRLTILTAVLVGFAVLLALTMLPALMAEGDPDGRVNEARRTLAQVLGGLLVLYGLYLTHRRIKVTEDGQVTERFTRSIEHLGAVRHAPDGKTQPNIEVRLGGIYALERIARDSRKDHWAVVETLTAYLRENFPWTNPLGFYLGEPGDGVDLLALEEGRQPLRLSTQSDLQALVTVIGRRLHKSSEPDRLELSCCSLRGVKVTGGDFSGGSFQECDLSYAIMGECDLRDAIFDAANLRHTQFAGADLRNASFLQAHLGGTSLWRAKVHGLKVRKSQISKLEDLTAEQRASLEVLDVDKLQDLLGTALRARAEGEEA